VRTGRESQVSAQHAVAVALSRGKAGLEEFSDAAVADPSLRALARRLRFIDDAAWPVESAQVTIVLRSGERPSHRVQAARGSLDAPLANVELADKLHRLAAYGRSGVETEPLVERLWKFENEPDAAAVVRITSARGPH
jgi:2-methylcitrate dehydratase PrpD